MCNKPKRALFFLDFKMLIPPPPGKTIKGKFINLLVFLSRDHID